MVPRCRVVSCAFFKLKCSNSDGVLRFNEQMLEVEHLTIRNIWHICSTHIATPAWKCVHTKCIFLDLFRRCNFTSRRKEYISHVNGCFSCAKFSSLYTFSGITLHRFVCVENITHSDEAASFDASSSTKCPIRLWLVHTADKTVLSRLDPVPMSFVLSASTVWTSHYWSVLYIRKYKCKKLQLIQMLTATCSE